MVSVIIPTYKRANYIERAINSILIQTYNDYEIIIVDDNDPDTVDRKALEKIMEKDIYRNNPKIRYIQHERNKNGSAARNTGIIASKGDYITFLDDDDFFLKDRLEILVNALNDNLEYNAVYSSLVICKNNNIIVYKEANKSGNLQKDVLMLNSFFRTGSNMFFRKKALLEINGFDESFKRHQDLEVFVRYFRNNKILAVNELLVVKDNDSRINSPKTEKALEYKEYYMKKFSKDIKKYNDKENIYSYIYFELLLNAVIENNKKYIKIIEKKLKNYTKITTKMKLKLIYAKFNKFIPFKSFLYSMKNKSICKKISSSKIEEINMLMNFDKIKEGI